MAWSAQVTLKRKVGHSNAMQVHKRRGRLTGSRTDVPSGYSEAGRACCVEATFHGGISPRESDTAPLEAVCSKLRPHQAKFPIRVKRRFTGRDASGRVGCVAFGAQVCSPLPHALCSRGILPHQSRFYPSTTGVERLRTATSAMVCQAFSGLDGRFPAVLAIRG